MMCPSKKCGIRFQPPAITLIFENDMKGKFSDCSRAAEQLRNNPQHKIYLEQVSLRQLEKLFIFFYKSIMDERFEKNQKKDEPNFVYDTEVEFLQDEQLQSYGWDTESPKFFFFFL
ncbi:unnamed protein product [Nyctereutes procyonoides]|uniref:Centrosomal protein of 19 kDa n=1 Tax=Nyctereutes procyonoides TaxID=34880 RepID=A0A811ZVE1_NYCPR|nr:unnamed protein product [Nyctereutes procyonoides]